MAGMNQNLMPSSLQFGHPLKSFLENGYPIHPALFRNQDNPTYPSGILAMRQFPLAGAGFESLTSPPQHDTESRTFQFDRKNKSFTIDAILGNKTREAEEKEEMRSYRKEDLVGRSSERKTHPYVSQLNCSIPFPCRSFQGFMRKEKYDKKVSPSSDWKQGKSKRVRTIFTPEQLERLEAEFERQQYMVGTERYYLAASLNLTEAQVKVWFQNRRIKWRKQNLERQHAKMANIDLMPGAESPLGSEMSDTEVDSLESSSENIVPPSDSLRQEAE